MRHALTILLLFILTFTACAADSGNTKEQIHASLLDYETTSRIFPLSMHGDCSGYAVGPHTMLTAGHCVFDNADLKSVSIAFGKAVPEVISEIILDGSDHALVIFANKTFYTYIKLAFAAPKQAERVFMWGNPTRLYGARDCWREGYYSGSGLYVHDGIGHTIYLFVMPAINGDSGSLIFNADGRIVGMANQGEAGFTGDEAFSFTPDQLDHATK